MRNFILQLYPYFIPFNDSWTAIVCPKKLKVFTALFQTSFDYTVKKNNYAKKTCYLFLHSWTIGLFWDCSYWFIMLSCLRDKREMVIGSLELKNELAFDQRTCSRACCIKEMIGNVLVKQNRQFDTLAKAKLSYFLPFLHTLSHCLHSPKETLCQLYRLLCLSYKLPALPSSSCKHWLLYFFHFVFYSILWK